MPKKLLTRDVSAREVTIGRAKKFAQNQNPISVIGDGDNRKVVLAAEVPEEGLSQEEGGEK